MTPLLLSGGQHMVIAERIDLSSVFRAASPRSDRQGSVGVVTRGKLTEYPTLDKRSGNHEVTAPRATEPLLQRRNNGSAPDEAEHFQGCITTLNQTQHQLASLTSLNNSHRAAQVHVCVHVKPILDGAILPAAAAATGERPRRYKAALPEHHRVRRYKRGEARQAAQCQKRIVRSISAIGGRGHRLHECNENFMGYG